jgi:hypothetical protein
MIAVDARVAISNCAEDTIAFCLESETFPVFFAWMERQGFVNEGYTAREMQRDMRTILAAARQQNR